MGVPVAVVVMVTVVVGFQMGVRLPAVRGGPVLARPPGPAVLLV